MFVSTKVSEEGERSDSHLIQIAAKGLQCTSTMRSQTHLMTFILKPFARSESIWYSVFGLSILVECLSGKPTKALGRKFSMLS